jgi:hypothetical protein
MKFTSLVAGTTALVMGAFVTVPAMADRIDNRQARQMERIDHGVRNGTLTRFEAIKLRKQQRDIARLERKFERDGRLTRNERATLTKLQNRASRMIRAEKHDNQVRGKRFNRNRGHRVGYVPFYRRWWWK